MDRLGIWHVNFFLIFSVLDGLGTWPLTLFFFIFSVLDRLGIRPLTLFFLNFQCFGWT